MHCEKQSHLFLRTILFGSYFICVVRYTYWSCTLTYICYGISHINSLNGMSNEAIHSGLVD